MESAPSRQFAGVGISSPQLGVDAHRMPSDDRGRLDF